MGILSSNRKAYLKPSLKSIKLDSRMEKFLWVGSLFKKTWKSSWASTQQKHPFAQIGQRTGNKTGLITSRKLHNSLLNSLSRQFKLDRLRCWWLIDQF